MSYWLIELHLKQCLTNSPPEHQAQKPPRKSPNERENIRVNNVDKIAPRKTETTANKGFVSFAP